MTLLEALVLGVVQGLTEFLPVSSSGHLVLGQALLGLQLPGVTFEVAVHVATLIAVLWVYRARVGALLTGLFRGQGDAASYIGLLLLASLPAAAAGILARPFFEGAFETPPVAAALLLVSGVLAWSIDATAERAHRDRPGVAAALAVGLAQAFAILPGISRSGSTVAVGTWTGVEPVQMAQFSFLLSVPAIGGAALLQLGEARTTFDGIGGAPLVVGFGAAVLAGVLAIRLFVRLLEAGKFRWFAYYCWTVGGLFLLATLVAPGLR